MRRALLIAGVAVAAIGTGGVAQAGIKDLEDERFKGGKENTFVGTCEVEGSVLYPDEKLTDDEQELTVGIEAAGTCDGELDGEMETFDVRMSAYKENETFSCDDGALDDLPAELNPEPSAGEDKENNIAGRQTTNTPNGIMFEGRNGGELVGAFELEDPAGTVERCLGDGNAKVDFTSQLVTPPDGVSG